MSFSRKITGKKLGYSFADDFIWEDYDEREQKKAEDQARANAPKAEVDPADAESQLAAYRARRDAQRSGRSSTLLTRAMTTASPQMRQTLGGS
jgi:hypothetical protein